MLNRIKVEQKKNYIRASEGWREVHQGAQQEDAKKLQQKVKV